MIQFSSYGISFHSIFSMDFEAAGFDQNGQNIGRECKIEGIYLVLRKKV
jgi:hypothetical protein